MATDDPYVTGFFDEITDCQWGSRWIQPVAQYLAGGALEFVNMSLTFPLISGGTPGFTLMTNGVLPSLPSIFLPVTAAEVAATITTGGNRKLTGFARSFPATPPPALPGGAVFYFIKLDDRLPAQGTLRVRLNLSGVVSGSWQLACATIKDVRPGIPAGNFDFVSSQGVFGSTSGGDTPPATTDFDVNLETLQVTLV